MKRIELCSTSECTGCMACKQVCPQSAISSVVIDGFDNPSIDKERCISCGLCMSVCPVLNLSGRCGNRHEDEKICIAAWNKDDSVRMRSSSGGSFSVFADQIFSEQGVVFGAAWDDKMSLVHQSVTDRESLDKLRRSKYVQSNPLDTYREVRGYLGVGRKVLYCGTPCQIAGLTSFLGKNCTDNLLTIDVLCQGVPSPYDFSKYIGEVESELKSKVVDCNFRTKDYGWRCGLFLRLLVKRPKQSKVKIVDRILGRNEFYNAFYNELFMRPSCYDCQFKCSSQGYYSDITIADFWRIGNKIPLNVDNYERGISAIIANTIKGKLFFEKCSDRLEVIERTWDEFTTNGGLRNSHKPKINDEAYEYLKTHSWRETQGKYFPLSRRKKISHILWFLLTEKYIRRIKKLLHL